MNATEKPERMLTFASGGWVLALTAVIGLALVAWAIAPVVLRVSSRPPGDGKDPATYGFDLTPAAGVALTSLAAGQLHRDLLRPLDDPAVIDGAAVLRYGADARGKYLVPTDRVIGLVIDGMARAYPLLVLNNHEVVNDTLAGTPVLVTYSPLCDSAAVFHRRGSDGVERRFGISGLLLNSNLLMYDRHDVDASSSAPATDGGGVPAAGPESLWSQLLARAVTGSAGAEGVQLQRIPAEVSTWKDWFERHPETTVVAPDKTMIKRYRETSYAGYLQTDRIAYPLDRAPDDGGPEGRGPKDRCVIVHADAESRLYALADIEAAADGAGRWQDDIAGERHEFLVGGNGTTVAVTREDGTPATVTTVLWFAAHAFGLGEN